MQVLIVGAGAVGQVFGRHLQLGGAEVSFFVRPRYADQARRGFTLYPLNQTPRWRPRRLEGCGVVTAPEQVGRPDCVVLCVSSTALRQRAWLRELGAAAGDATIVTLQPGLEDRPWMIEQLGGAELGGAELGGAELGGAELGGAELGGAELGGAELGGAELGGAELPTGGPARRLVSGLIGFMSYTARAQGGAALLAPGVAYWLPPLSPLPFSGPDRRVTRVVDCLRRGGLPAVRRDDVQAQLAFTGPLLQMQIIALECAGWSFAELGRQRALRRLAFAATREAICIAEAHLKRRAPALVRALRPWMIGAGLGLTRRLAPFDLESFFRLHFTKVGDQTRHELASLLRLARQLGVDAPALQELTHRISGDGGGTSAAPVE